MGKDNLYETDEHEWKVRQAELFEQGRLDEVDYDSMLQMLLEMTQSDKNSVEGLARILVMHLLKLKCQPEKRTSSWFNTVASHRASVKKLVASRRLRNHLVNEMPEVYRIARKLAAGETGLKLQAFPAEVPFTLEEILDDDFYAGQEPPWGKD